jgi:glutamyl-Q tRNA(Asp) synthetase
MSHVLRFAPSPNGELHLGHARSAVIGFEIARAVGGRFLLRIEDIDPGRSREAYIDSMIDDLGFLGITWDGEVLRQSQRFGLYGAWAARLEAAGLLYRCYASRTEIQAAAEPGAVDPDGTPLYPGRARVLSQAETDRRRAAGMPFALRLDMVRALEVARSKRSDWPLTIAEFDEHALPTPREADPGRWGDAVIVRKDVPASYHLACIVDDYLQGVTLVTRGADLAAATDLHRLLQTLLGLPAPAYHHHALIFGPDGRKLSKSLKSPSLRELRVAGADAAEIRRLAIEQNFDVGAWRRAVV